MSTLEDVRKTIEAAIGNLTPAKAQQLAKGFTESGAAKEQVSKTAAELLEWSQRSRERFAEFVRKEIAEQMKHVGMATQSDVDALKKRVRNLERAGGTPTPAKRAKRNAAKKPASKRSTSAPRKPAASSGASST